MSKSCRYQSAGQRTHQNCSKVPCSVCPLWTEVEKLTKPQYVQYPPTCTNRNIVFLCHAGRERNSRGEKSVEEASRMENNMWKATGSQVGSLLSLPWVSLSPCLLPPFKGGQVASCLGFTDSHMALSLRALYLKSYIEVMSEYWPLI